MTTRKLGHAPRLLDAQIIDHLPLADVETQTKFVIEFHGGHHWRRRRGPHLALFALLEPSEAGGADVAGIAAERGKLDFHRVAEWF